MRSSGTKAALALQRSQVDAMSEQLLRRERPDSASNPALGATIKACVQRYSLRRGGAIAGAGDRVAAVSSHKWIALMPDVHLGDRRDRRQRGARRAAQWCWRRSGSTSAAE